MYLIFTDSFLIFTGLSLFIQSSCFIICDAFFCRDLIPIVAALEYNQWFTKLSSKDLKLVSITVKDGD